MRTGVLFSRGIEQAVKDVASRSTDDRPVRNPGRVVEEQTLGYSGQDHLKTVSLADSDAVPEASFKVYMLRVATLEKRAPGKFELRWKQSPRGSVEGRRVDESTPQFAEMANPGTVFEGTWTERAFLREAEITRALHWKEALGWREIAAAVNTCAGAQLAAHREYAVTGGLDLLAQNIAALEGRLEAVRAQGDACLLTLGWGGGFLSKVATLDTNSDSYRQVLHQSALYGKVLRPGVPFPKTRRIVFLENRPATLPGWALLETF
jgi:CRISPR-associated protein Csm5